MLIKMEQSKDGCRWQSKLCFIGQGRCEYRNNTRTLIWTHHNATSMRAPVSHWQVQNVQTVGWRRYTSNEKANKGSVSCVHNGVGLSTGATEPAASFFSRRLNHERVLERFYRQSNCYDCYCTRNRFSTPQPAWRNTVLQALHSVIGYACVRLLQNWPSQKVVAHLRSPLDSLKVV